MPGPVPKRTDQRRRANKPDVELLSAAGAVVVNVPEPDELWHPLARDWYVSLSESGQAVFYEPSDWQTARIWAEVLSRQLSSDKVSAVMIQSWASSATELLTTEGSRRRARLELERVKPADEDEDASVTVLNAWRDQLNA